MNKLLTILMLLAIAVLPASSKKKETKPLKYDIVGNGIAQTSGRIVRITIYAKDKNKVSSDDFAKAAVHGVLFRGYSDSSTSGFDTLAKYPAIMGSPMAEAQHAEFFKPFFEDGLYAGYVQCMEDTRRTVKVGKEWKVSCDIVVSDVMLRQDLEKAGIKKKMGGGL